MNNEAYEQYTVTELAKMETLCEGQAEDLRVDEGNVRWWLSRCGPEDGQDFPIGVEVRIKGVWSEVHRYGCWTEWRRAERDAEDADTDE